MSVHLTGGGGGAEHDPQLYGAFLAEAHDRAVDAGRIEGPRIAIVVVHDGLGPEVYAGWAATLAWRTPVGSRADVVVEGVVIDSTRPSRPKPKDTEATIQTALRWRF